MLESAMNLTENLRNFALKQKRFLGNLYDRPAVVLNYHRITDQSVDPHGQAVPPGIFEEQLKYLKAHFHFLSADEFIGLRKTRKPFPKGALLLTFDDGYADNLNEALPIIESLSIEAVFHVSTGRIDTREFFWWDLLSLQLLAEGKHADRLELTLGGKVHAFDTSTVDKRRRAHQSIYPLLKPVSPEEKKDALRQIQECFGQDEFDPAPWRSLTSEEISRLSQSRWAKVGAHGHSHVPLMALSEIEASQEIVESIKILTKLSGKEVRFFSYPHGGRNEYSAANVRTCSKQGLDAAFSNHYGQVHRWTPSYDMPRICIGNWPHEVFRNRMNRFFWF